MIAKSYLFHPTHLIYLRNSGESSIEEFKASRLFQGLLDKFLSQRIVLKAERHVAGALSDIVWRVFGFCDSLDHMVRGFLPNDYLDSRLNNSGFVSCNRVNFVSKRLNVV